MSDCDPGTASRIPERRRLVDFRNVLIHGYALVDDGIVWGTLEHRTGPLAQMLPTLLAEPQGETGSDS